MTEVRDGYRKYTRMRYVRCLRNRKRSDLIIMRSKEYLKSIRHETLELAHLRMKIEWLYSTLYPGGLKLKEVDVQETLPSDQLSEKFAEIDEATRELKTRTEALTKKHLEAEKLISMLEEVRHRNILQLYYLGDKRISLDEVAQEMNYSEREIDYLHKDALKALDAIIAIELKPSERETVKTGDETDPESGAGSGI